MTLRIFILGRVVYVLEIKKAYLELIVAKLKIKKVYNDEVKVYDEDLTKVPPRNLRPKKLIV